MGLTPRALVLPFGVIEDLLALAFVLFTGIAVKLVLICN